MEKFKCVTERQQQFLSAHRVIQKPGIPIIGYYFIRSVRFEWDEKGYQIGPFANVNWRLNEEDDWEDRIPGNVFRLNLSYLMGPFSLGPKVIYDELRHQVIVINSIKADTSFNREDIYVDWDITGFVDLLDALPYFSLFDRLVLAADDFQHQLLQEHLDAVQCDEEKFENEILQTDLGLTEEELPYDDIEEEFDFNDYDDETNNNIQQ